MGRVKYCLVELWKLLKEERLTSLCLSPVVNSKTSQMDIDGKAFIVSDLIQKSCLIF